MVTADSVPEVAEVAFPLMPGTKISSMHGYSVYAALKAIFPWMGECPLTSISSISGIRDGKGFIETAEFSRLLIRTPSSRAALLYSLAGRRLSIGQGQIALKVPTIAPLSASSELQARLVVIHLKPEDDEVPPDRFLAVATRQLSDRGIKGRISLLLKNGMLDRKVLRIKNRNIPGYGVKVSALSPADSLKLQVAGLGGKRKMGCGFFN
jgi:CRISPR-associated endonuclease/helicase Cas3